VIACAGVIPLALIAGPIRGIPFWWQLIDMSFGVVGVIPLLFALRGIRRLADSAQVRSATVTSPVASPDGSTTSV
jgi:hypothetical protein